jgi:hypothetical protein
LVILLEREINIGGFAEDWESQPNKNIPYNSIELKCLHIHGKIQIQSRIMDREEKKIKWALFGPGYNENDSPDSKWI